MKEIEMKLISELMKNSRRSDRDLARAIGTSQPTITRLRTRMEKEGLIRAYTMVPDFTKIGYHLLAVIFVKLKNLDAKKISEAREIARQQLRESNFGIVMLERGEGLGYDGVILSFYEDYSAYVKHKNELKQFPFIASQVSSFLVNLDDEIRYQPMNFTHLANLLVKREKKGKDESQLLKQRQYPLQV